MGMGLTPIVATRIRATIAIRIVIRTIRHPTMTPDLSGGMTARAGRHGGIGMRTVLALIEAFSRAAHTLRIFHRTTRLEAVIARCGGRMSTRTRRCARLRRGGRCGVRVGTATRAATRAAT